MRLLALFSLATTIRAVSNKCFSDSECSEVWPGASCVRSRCRCPPDTVRKKSSSREFVCLSLIDITTGEAGPPLTCPLPEGAGYQVVLRNGSSSTFCSSKTENCPDGYECIQGFGVTSDYGYDGVCCPSRETTCSHPIFDNDDGTLSRWGFDGQNCIQYLWNPNRASTANTMRSFSSPAFSGVIPVDAVEKKFCLSSGPGGQNVQKNATKVEIRFNVDNAGWLPDELKEPLKKHLANRVNNRGELIIDSDRTRERNMNLADCFDKLRATIYEVQRDQSLRVESEGDREILRKKAEKAAKHRLAEKRLLSQKKAFRSTVDL